MRKVAVLGAGSWGTTFAKVLADGESEVTLWARRSEIAREIRESNRNSDYLPGINLPAALSATDNLEACVAGASQVYATLWLPVTRAAAARYLPRKRCGARSAS